MVVNGSELRQGRIHVVDDVGQLVKLVCALEEEAAEAVHAQSGHYCGRDAVQIVSGVRS